jgi:hypothetical protein
MKKLVAVSVAVLGAAIVPAQASAVAPHLHCLTTPGGTHAIALGVTHHAPHETLENFHSNVHLGVFVNGNNPNTLAAIAPSGSC